MPRPLGPDAVRAALVEAAAGLLAERPPAAVSVRDVATAAGVNHGLVHRYFGSKDALVRAALRAGAAASVEQFVGAGDTSDLLARLRDAAADPRAGWRLLAHCLLEGYGDEVPRGGEYPGIDRLVEGCAAAQAAGVLRGDLDPEDAARLLLTTTLGWLLFHDYVAAATHVEDGDGLDELGATLFRVLAPPPTTP